MSRFFRPNVLMELGRMLQRQSERGFKVDSLFEFPYYQRSAAELQQKLNRHLHHQQMAKVYSQPLQVTVEGAKLAGRSNVQLLDTIELESAHGVRPKV
jgi:hypothetical protein